MAALGLTLGLAIVSGTITGFLMRLPIFEQIDEVDELYVIQFFLQTIEIAFIYIRFCF